MTYAQVMAILANYDKKTHIYHGLLIKQEYDGALPPEDRVTKEQIKNAKNERCKVRHQLAAAIHAKRGI